MNNSVGSYFPRDLLEAVRTRDPLLPHLGVFKRGTPPLLGPGITRTHPWTLNQTLYSRTIVLEERAKRHNKEQKWAI